MAYCNGIANLPLTRRSAKIRSRPIGRLKTEGNGMNADNAMISRDQEETFEFRELTEDELMFVSGGGCIACNQPNR